MKLSDLNNLLRAVKRQYGDIDIALNLNNSDIQIKSLLVKETTVGNIALINPNNTQTHYISAIGKTLKTEEFSQFSPIRQVPVKG